MYFYRTILVGLTIFLNAFDSGAQLYQISDFSMKKIEILDSVGKRFQFELEIYNDFGEPILINKELTYELTTGSLYVYKSDSNWVFSRFDLLSDYDYLINYYNEVYFLPIDKIDTIIEYDGFGFIARNKDGYLIYNTEIQDSYSWIPYFVYTTEKPLLFHQYSNGDYPEQRYFIKSNKKSNTYELHNLISEEIIKEIKADSILSIPDTWSKHLLIKKDSKIQLVDYTTDSLILDDIQSYFLSRNEDSTSAFKYACLFYDERGELVEHVDRMYNRYNVPELYYNGSTILTYFVEGGFSSFPISQIHEINLLGQPQGGGSEYLPYGFSLKTDSNYYILCFFETLKKEVFKLNDTLGVYSVAPQYNVIFDAKNNQIVFDSISDFRSIHSNVLYIKTKNNYLYTPEGKLLDNSTIPGLYNDNYITEILLQNSGIRALHHQYFKVDYQNIVNQIAQGSDGQYWSCVFNYIVFSIDSASFETRLMLCNELVARYPNINELNYIQALLYLNLSNTEQCKAAVKKMELYAADVQNSMRIAAFKQLLFSNSKKTRNLFISDLFNVIAILEKNSKDPYLLADLYVLLIKHDVIQNVKEINTCELIEKFDLLISKGNISPSELLTSDLNILNEKRTKCL